MLVRVEEKLTVRIRNVSLTVQQDDFVERLVKSGEYQNASEAIRDALRVLQQKLRQDKLTLRALGAQLTTAGLDTLERSDVGGVVGVHVKYIKGSTSTQRQRVFTLLRTLASLGWYSHTSATSLPPVPNGGALRGSVATQRSFRQLRAGGS